MVRVAVEQVEMPVLFEIGIGHRAAVPDRDDQGQPSVARPANVAGSPTVDDQASNCSGA